MAPARRTLAQGYYSNGKAFMTRKSDTPHGISMQGVLTGLSHLGGQRCEVELFAL
jgi:hypothetical protein